MNLYLGQRARPLRVCWINHDHRIVDSTLEQLECEMDKVYQFDMVQLASIDADNFDPCDLLVIIAHRIVSEQLLPWIKSLATRLSCRIWTPALIVGDLNNRATADLVEFAIQSNWYFDVVDRHHLSSLAIRMANLIRIHDHLHELYRYESSLAKIEQKVYEQKQRVDTLIKQRHDKFDGS